MAVAAPLDPILPAPPPEIVLDGKTVPTTRFKSELREKGFAEVELRLDQLSEQVDEVLDLLLMNSPVSRRQTNIQQARSSRTPGGDGYLERPAVDRGSYSLERPSINSLARPSTSLSVDPSRSSTSETSDRGSFVSFAARRSATSGRVSRMPSVSTRPRKTSELGRAAANTRRPKRMPVRNVDLKVAWHMADEGSEMLEGLPTELAGSMKRLVHRDRSEHIWELLDDSESSRLAWWISFVLKVVTISSVVVSNLQISEEDIIDRGLAAALETIFDVIFIVEFTARLLTTPSRSAFLRDPYNWADLISSFGIIFRASIGFVIRTPTSSVEERNVQVILLFILPVVRFLKLLRYIDSFRLLVDAVANSIASFPVLLYTMALILLIAANGIYLAEDRENIPSLPHSHWLALVTMTTVGFGDYTPKSSWGIVCVGVLSMVSTCFVAMPVGIIGREVSNLWESRRYILLLERMRKCLWKWGVEAKDLRVLFEYVDIDGDGQLSMHEFMELIQQMRIGMTHVSAKDLFDLFDDDGNGQIDYYELLRHVFPGEISEDAAELEKLVTETSRRASEAISAFKAPRHTSGLVSGSQCQTIEEAEDE